ncbi:MAG TPA: hypothetical protein VF518_11590, partial [Polyangia bacterium]
MTRIEAIAPIRLDQLVAGPNTLVVLRVEIVSGGPAAGATWNWQGSCWDRNMSRNTPLSATQGRDDPTTVSFNIATAGQYTFKATDSTGACSATIVTVNDALAAADSAIFDQYVLVQAAAPASADIPVQSVSIGLRGAPPFGQSDILLDPGVPVQISPVLANNLEPAYVRISRVDGVGSLVDDGLAGANATRFTSRLLNFVIGAEAKRQQAYYDVLVVPLDSPAGDAIGATAPQLFQRRTPAQLQNVSLNLVGGATVTGTASANGQAVVDARVILTNQDPSKAPAPSLLFSSVGASDEKGNFTLHTQPDQYWISVSPPSGSGLSEAFSPASVAIGGNTTVGFQWSTPSSAALTLTVMDANGTPIGGTQVRLTSSRSTSVGTFTVVTAAGG